MPDEKKALRYQVDSQGTWINLEDVINTIHAAQNAEGLLESTKSGLLAIADSLAILTNRHDLRSDAYTIKTLKAMFKADDQEVMRYCE